MKMTSNNEPHHDTRGARCPVCGDQYVQYHEQKACRAMDIRDDAAVCTRIREGGYPRETWVHIAERNISLDSIPRGDGGGR